MTEADAFLLESGSIVAHCSLNRLPCMAALALYVWSFRGAPAFFDPARDSGRLRRPVGTCDLDVHPRIAAAFAMARRSRWDRWPRPLKKAIHWTGRIYSVLILLAIGILVSRSFSWSDFFAQQHRPDRISFFCTGQLLCGPIFPSSPSSGGFETSAITW